MLYITMSSFYTYIHINNLRQSLDISTYNLTTWHTCRASQPHSLSQMHAAFTVLECQITQCIFDILNLLSSLYNHIYLPLFRSAFPNITSIPMLHRLAQIFSLLIQVCTENARLTMQIYLLTIPITTTKGQQQQQLSMSCLDNSLIPFFLRDWK